MLVALGISPTSTYCRQLQQPGVMISKEIGRLVSSRVLENLKDGEVMSRLYAVLANIYHPESNPNGVVNLGVAENAST